MQVYLVGGAVRDKLLGRIVKERDWVVVGATEAQMQAQGFRRVGKDFPVFLHPETHEEYALARTERNTAPGYRGFSISASPDVTLEEDLLRRDLTINAMAMDAEGHLIDPFDGRRDLRERWLRHVSPAFAEDPVRVLRLARFAARYCHLGFRIAPETLNLMREMVGRGEIDALVAERVWAETVKALAEPNPEQFFQTLRACGALGRIFPELDVLFGVPQRAEYHPEIDTGIHILMCLQQAVALGADVQTRFAVLVHDLGKGCTPAALWPRHHEHEARGVDLINQLCERLRAPREYRELAVLVSLYHTHCHRACELKPKTVLKVLEALDGLRRPERFERFLLACEADARGRQGLEQRAYSQAACLRAALAAIRAVDVASLVAKGHKGGALKEALRLARLQAISGVANVKEET